MPKYYCDYCDTHLTHNSPSVRKTHCGGRKHKDNVRMYYQNWVEEQVGEADYEYVTVFCMMLIIFRVDAVNFPSSFFPGSTRD